MPQASERDRRTAEADTASSTSVRSSEELTALLISPMARTSSSERWSASLRSSSSAVRTRPLGQAPEQRLLGTLRRLGLDRGQELDEVARRLRHRPPFEEEPPLLLHRQLPRPPLERAVLSRALGQDLAVLAVDDDIGDVGITGHAAHRGLQELAVLGEHPELAAVGQV